MDDLTRVAEQTLVDIADLLDVDVTEGDMAGLPTFEMGDLH